MATELSEPGPGGSMGPDPGRFLRYWVAFFLRVGVGLTMLASGMAGYFLTRGPMGAASPLLQNSSLLGLDTLAMALPCLTIGLGLALTLGFLTKATAIASAMFSLLLPVFTIIVMLIFATLGNLGRPIRPDYEFYVLMLIISLVSLSSLLPLAALIWLSPLENHPFSVDALIFGRYEPQAFVRPQATQMAAREPQVESEAEVTIRILD